MTADTVTINGRYELDGWTLQSATGIDVPKEDLPGPDSGDLERFVRDKLLEHFQDMFITTYPPEIIRPEIDGMEPDSWESLQEVLNGEDDEDDEPMERSGVDGPVVDPGEGGGR